MKSRIPIIIFLFAITEFFSQTYQFDYELDTNKANGKKRKMALMRVNLENKDIALQIYKPNENYFATIWDSEKEHKHYFFYNKTKKREKYKYIGTVVEKFLNPVSGISKIESSQYPMVDYLVFLHKEFGENNVYYVHKKDAIPLSTSKTIYYKTTTQSPKMPSEVPLSSSQRTPTEITLPEKIIIIPNNKIQDLTKCVIVKRGNDLWTLESKHKPTIISNTCY